MKWFLMSILFVLAFSVTAFAQPVEEEPLCNPWCEATIHGVPGASITCSCNWGGCCGVAEVYFQISVKCSDGVWGTFSGIKWEYPKEIPYSFNVPGWFQPYTAVDVRISVECLTCGKGAENHAYYP